MIEVRIPQLGLTMESADIVGWLVTVGDRVEKGQVLAQISTDKIEADVECPVDGTISELIGDVGDTLAVGAVIAGITPNTSPSS